MSFKLHSGSLALCIGLLGLSGCFGKKKDIKNDTDFGFFKTEEAQKACVSSNISQWEASGPFVHNFLRCASNRSVDGQEKLSGLNALLDNLDDTKIQRVLDFVLSVDPNATTHEERYPYLLAMTTVLDRGLLDSRAAGLNLTTERLGSLQDFLVTLDATRSKEIISTWSRSGQLEQTLNELGAFIDSMDAYSVEVFAHEILSGNTLRKEALYVSRRILREDSLFLALNSVVDARPVQVLNAKEQTQLLKPYRESLAASDSQTFVSVVPVDKITKTPLVVLSDEHKQFSLKELTGLKDFILSFWKSYQALATAERDSLDSRIAEAVDTVMNVQAHPIKWMLALLSDGNQLSAKDLDRVTFAVDQLLLEGNDLSLEAIRAKAGASKLMNDLEKLLTQGGKIPGCAIFDSAPLALGTDDFNVFSESLAKLTVPQASCSDRVPLLAAIQHFTGLELADNFSPDLWKAKAADPALVRKLTLETFKTLLVESQTDPYRFYNLQLAVDRLSPEFLNALSQRLDKASDWSMVGIARLDNELNAEFAGVLEADFIEKLLTYRIELLAVQSEQFKDLAPQTDAEVDDTLEARSSRVFAGLYTGGPLEQLMATRHEISLFPFTDNQQDLKTYLLAHPSVWSRMIFKAREAEGAFRTPALGTLAGETSTIFSGAGSSLRSYLGFTATDAAVKPVINAAIAGRILEPHQAVKSFVDDADGRSGWALWYQHYANGPLVSKDVPVELSKKLEEWYLTSLIPTLSDPAFWPELEATGTFASSSALAPDYFDIEGYSTEEARLLTSFYIKHFQKPSPRLPVAGEFVLGKSSVPKNDLTAFADPISGFFSASYLVKDDSEAQYSAFAKNFPKVLRQSAQLSQLKASVLPDYAGFQSIQNTWTMPDFAQVNSVTTLSYDTETPFSLLSALDLLTYSKPDRRFIPQPIVGFAGQLCRSKTKDPVDDKIWVDGVQACPMDFQGSSPEEAYNKFKEFVSQSAVDTFCPYLASDTLGPKFVWAQRLGLTLDNPALCASQSRSSLMEEYRFPEWHSARVLNDIFVMGRAAKLKAGLAEVPAALRFYKIKAKGLEPQHEAEQFLSLAKGVWTEKNAMDQRRREFFAGNFWVGSPNLLNSYFNLVAQNIDPFTWRTTLISYSQRNEQGEQKDTLRDILRVFSAEQKASAAAGESAILFGVKVFDKIFENPEYRAFGANFVSDLNSSEAYDFYANELPLALTQLFPIDQNPFEWMDPGLSFSKNLGQHAMLRSWQIMSEQFTPTEMNRFLTQVHQALKVLPEISERGTLLQKFAGEILKLGTLYTTEGNDHLVVSLETLGKTWSRLDFGLGMQKQWTSFVTKVTNPLQGLDGQNKITGETALENILSALIIKGPSLAQILQSANQVEGSVLKTEPLFWQKWLDNLLSSVETKDSGAYAFAGFISEKRFAFSTDQGGLWLDILRPGDLQNRAVAAIEAVDSVPENLWREAMLEMTELSSRLTRALGYLKSHMIWNEDPDHNAYRIALDQLYELSQDEELREKQLELVTLWLNGESESKDAEPKGD